MIFALLFVGLLSSAQAAQAAVPRVVTTIKPLHSLAAALMEDVGEPELLLSAGDSPHTYSMRPSDARALRGADLLVYISPHLETFLGPALEARTDKATNLAVAQIDNILLLEGRQDGGETEQHEHDHGHDHAHERDYHLWLDPHNAQVIVAHLAERLADIDPAHAAQYRGNATQLKRRLQRLDKELNERLAAVRGEPYIVFHDAYQYFERRYDLDSAGVVTLSPEQSPGAHHLREIRNRIRRRQVTCVFIEPQFKPAIVSSLTRGMDVAIGELDPVGADIEPGPDAYFKLLEGLADGFIDCLDG